MDKIKVFAYAHSALENLFKKPATTSYPFRPAEFPERMRGHVEIHTEDCISCGLCMRSCPAGAIAVDRAAGTWVIDRFDCVQCGNCVNMCPKKCLEIVPGYTKPAVAKAKDTFRLPEKKTAAAAPKKPVMDTEKCVYCTLCAKKCPQEAIAVDRAEKSWTLDDKKCVSCGLCASSCPKKAIEMK